MKQFLHNHGLFAALLTASLVGHVSVKWLPPIVSLEPQLAQVESGHNSVSIQLVAVAPQVPDATEIELPDPLPPDRSHLAEAPDPEREVKIDAPQRSVSNEVAFVTADASSPLETASSEISPHSLSRHRQRDLQRPHTEQTPNELARRRRNRDIEVADADIEIPHTIMSEQSAGAEVAPSFVSRPLPAYPADLLLRRIEGTVQLLVTIGADGRVVDAALHRSSGYAAMDQSALKTIHRWTFRPARRGNTPIAKRAIVPIDFTIQR